MMRGILIFAFFTVSTVLVIVLQPGPREDFSNQVNPQAMFETSRNQMDILEQTRVETPLPLPDDVISDLKSGLVTQTVEPTAVPEASNTTDVGESLVRLQAALSASINTDAAVSDALADTSFAPSAGQEPVQAIAPELRDMSWQTLNALNSIGHVSKAPGQQGSLLSSIVRRSMGHVDGSQPAQPVAAQTRQVPVRKSQPVAQAAVQQAAKPRVSVSATQHSYTVASGDTLALIAIKLYSSALATDRLLEDNPALRQNPNALRIGQQLRYSMP